MLQEPIASGAVRNLGRLGPNLNPLKLIIGDMLGINPQSSLKPVCQWVKKNIHHSKAPFCNQSARVGHCTFGVSEVDLDDFDDLLLDRPAW
jgi:hypothetical protein